MCRRGYLMCKDDLLCEAAMRESILMIVKAGSSRGSRRNADAGCTSRARISLLYIRRDSLRSPRSIKTRQACYGLSSKLPQQISASSFRSAQLPPSPLSIAL